MRLTNATRERLGRDMHFPDCARAYTLVLCSCIYGVNVGWSCKIVFADAFHTARDISRGERYCLPSRLTVKRRASARRGRTLLKVIDQVDKSVDQVLRIDRLGAID